MSETEFDVVVIGMGPVGCTLANLLGQRGLRVAVMEREAAGYRLPPRKKVCCCARRPGERPMGAAYG